MLTNSRVVKVSAEPYNPRIHDLRNQTDLWKGSTETEISWRRTVLDKITFTVSNVA